MSTWIIIGILVFVPVLAWLIWEERKLPIMPDLKKIVAKAVHGRKNTDPVVKKLLAEYLEKGKITRSEAMEIWPRIQHYINFWFSVAVILSTFMLFGTVGLALFPVTILVTALITWYDVTGMVGKLMPGGMTAVERDKWDKTWDERLKQAKGSGKTALQVMHMPDPSKLARKL
jgi:hypothetical protein